MNDRRSRVEKNFDRAETAWDIGEILWMILKPLRFIFSSFGKIIKSILDIIF